MCEYDARQCCRCSVIFTYTGRFSVLSVCVYLEGWDEAEATDWRVWRHL